ncbi:oxygenase MpaB family protein [Aldersonia kunmingensis]|uniref:oxygenase MpaB family protein n=1 Tax=Aldersonia kunmingensis TaxID=408066 RepID=UPI00082C6629|nr:oxygenase MpaB family protein [Aldersonia kunmingensis]
MAVTAEAAVDYLDDSESFDMAPYVDGAAVLLGGVANVIMQLSHAPIGYGVVESKVDSGKATLHPLKRLRTTVTYLSVAHLGSPAEKAAYRAAVNSVHRHVRSDADSPVRYNAFDPELQRWVAACLYFGTVDLIERMHGPLDAEVAEAMYQHSAHLGTTLQMRREMWPADRAAFAQYWQDGLAKAEIDPTIRAYLADLLRLRNIATPLQFVFADIHQWVATGLLPQQLREQMGLEWSASDDRRLSMMLLATGAVVRRMPPKLRQFPMNFFLWDLQRRLRKGHQLV